MLEIDTLELSGAPVLNSGSTLVVSSGTLRFNNVTAGTGATIQSNVTATISPGATLQLAGTVSALSDASDPASVANINTQGTGNLYVTGSNQSVGIVIGDMAPDADGLITYLGSTVVGDGHTSASLTATQILQDSLTINDGSTVTIRPSGPGVSSSIADKSSDSEAQPAVAAASAAFSESNLDSFSAIESDIQAGSFGSVVTQRLENRLATIERLAASDPDLDVSLFENALLSSIASTSSLGEPDAKPIDADRDAFAPESTVPLLLFPSSASDSPTAVPEPSTFLLAASALVIALIARRRQMQHRERNRHARPS